MKKNILTGLLLALSLTMVADVFAMESSAAPASEKPARRNHGQELDDQSRMIAAQAEAIRKLQAQLAALIESRNGSGMGSPQGAAASAGNTQDQDITDDDEDHEDSSLLVPTHVTREAFEALRSELAELRAAVQAFKSATTGVGLEPDDKDEAQPPHDCDGDALAARLDALELACNGSDTQAGKFAEIVTLRSEFQELRLVVKIATAAAEGEMPVELVLTKEQIQALMSLVKNGEALQELINNREALKAFVDAAAKPAPKQGRFAGVRAYLPGRLFFESLALLGFAFAAQQYATCGNWSC